MGLREVTWDKDEIGANICGSNFSTRESTWGHVGQKPPFIDAIEALYQLSYDPFRETDKQQITAESVWQDRVAAVRGSP